MTSTRHQRHHSNWSRVLVYLMIAILAWAPFPFASNRPWSWLLLAILTAILLLAWSLSYLQKKPPIIRLPKALQLSCALFFLVWLWAVMQTLSFMPESLTHPMWGEASAYLAGPTPHFITLNTHETITALLRLTTYGIIFWLSTQFFLNTRHASFALKSFVIITTVYAIYGVGALFSGNNMILWYEKPAYIGVVTSTFINRNSFATYASMGLLCTLGIILDMSMGILKSRMSGRRKAGLLMERFMGSAIIWPLSALCLSTALFLTASRGGILSFCVGLLSLLGLLSYARQLKRRHMFALISILILFMGFNMFVSGDLLGERMLTPNAGGDRLNLYKLVWLAIMDSPILGTGYGTFIDIFPMYNDGTIPNGAVVNKAHNTYLEMALELGIPALLAFLFAMFILVWMCIKGSYTRKRNNIYPALGAAITLLVAFHSLVDFSLQIPAVAVSYAFLLGLFVAQSQSSQKAVESSTKTIKATPPAHANVE